MPHRKSPPAEPTSNQILDALNQYHQACRDQRNAEHAMRRSMRDPLWREPTSLDLIREDAIDARAYAARCRNTQAVRSALADHLEHFFFNWLRPWIRDEPIDPEMPLSPGVYEISPRAFITQMDLIIRYCEQKPRQTVSGEWSVPLKKDQIAERLEVDPRTLLRRIRSGRYSVEQISRQSHRIRLDTLSGAERKRFE